MISVWQKNLLILKDITQNIKHIIFQYALIHKSEMLEGWYGIKTYTISSVFIAQCVLWVSMRHAPYMDSAKLCVRACCSSQNKVLNL